MSPQEMLDQLVSSGDDTGVDSQELYGAFRDGLPIESLRPLLISEYPLARAHGAYQIYELDWLCHPLIPEITNLLSDPKPQIRSDAAVALSACATPNDADALGRVLLLLSDPDPFVQRAAIDFVRRKCRWRLNIAVNAAAGIATDQIYEEFPGRVGKPYTKYIKITDETIKELLANQHPVAQRFGVGLALQDRFFSSGEMRSLVDTMTDPGCRHVIDHWKKTPGRRYDPCRSCPARHTVLSSQNRIIQSSSLGHPH